MREPSNFEDAPPLPSSTQVDLDPPKHAGVLTSNSLLLLAGVWSVLSQSSPSPDPWPLNMYSPDTLEVRGLGGVKIAGIIYNKNANGFLGRFCQK